MRRAGRGIQKGNMMKLSKEEVARRKAIRQQFEEERAEKRAIAAQRQELLAHSKIMILDIETAPAKVYAWGQWQQNIGQHQVIKPGYVLCAAWQWEDDPRISFVSRWDHGKKVMLKELHAAMSKAHAVVTFNGDKFDHKVLNAEFVRIGLNPPEPSKSIDLYRVVKRRFKFPYNRLDDVLRELGGPRKKSTGGFDLWVQVMNRDPEARAKMAEYNMGDVESTTWLYNRLREWLPGWAQPASVRMAKKALKS
jgi:DNA polymerase elongation subunit (family B)